MDTSKISNSPARAPAARRTLAVWATAGVMAVAAFAAAGTAIALPGGGHGGMHAMHGAGMGLPMMGRGLERMLDEVKATDAQRSQIRQIADAAAADLRSQRDSARGLRQRGLEIFTQPNVDANAAEALRQQMLQQHDTSSKRMLQAMVDVSRVLTPEQRTQLASAMKARADRMREHMERRGGATAPSSR